MKEFHLKYDVPTFSFSMITEYSHGDNNPAQYVDQDLVDTLETLRKNKVSASDSRRIFIDNQKNGIVPSDLSPLNLSLGGVLQSQDSSRRKPRRKRATFSVSWFRLVCRHHKTFTSLVLLLHLNSHTVSGVRTYILGVSHGTHNWHTVCCTLETDRTQLLFRNTD